MNHALVLEQDCSVNISGITVYIDAYEISAENKFLFQPMAVSGIRFQELGRHPASIKITGRILKSEGINPAAQLNGHMTNSTVFNLNMDGLYINAAKLKKYSINTQTNSQFHQCVVECYCDSYINGGS